MRIEFIFNIVVNYIIGKTYIINPLSCASGNRTHSFPQTPLVRNIPRIHTHTFTNYRVLKLKEKKTGFMQIVVRKDRNQMNGNSTDSGGCVRPGH